VSDEKLKVNDDEEVWWTLTASGMCSSDEMCSH